MKCRWYWTKIGGGASCGKCPQCHDKAKKYYEHDHTEEEE